MPSGSSVSRRSYDFTSLSGLQFFLEDHGSLGDVVTREAVPLPYVSLPMLENSPSFLVSERSLPLGNLTTTEIYSLRPGYRCPVCGIQQFGDDLEKFISHLDDTHSNGYWCPFDGCAEFFRRCQMDLQHHIRVAGHSMTNPVDKCQYNVSVSRLEDHDIDVLTKLERDEADIVKRLRNVMNGDYFQQSALRSAFEMWLLHVILCFNTRSQPTSRGTRPDNVSPMMERYLSSSSEDEAAALEDIHEESSHQKSPIPPGDFENWRDKDEVSSTAPSSRNWSSRGSHSSLESRRKLALRRRKRKVVRVSKKQPHTEPKFQCTFCMADFTTSGNWSRHERNIHLVEKHWICFPAANIDDMAPICVYCDRFIDNFTSEIEPHDLCTTTCRAKVLHCTGKPKSARTFACKDHLKQHLKHCHDVSIWTDTFESWWETAAILPKISRCGFCDERFDDWDKRMRHIAKEFRNGRRMNEHWKGSWGLSQDWEECVLKNGAIMPDNRGNNSMKPH
ncbi:hypothetical protein K440DRAFT_642749 [Wilcoxina mikolae CBS 423.85]|nr:hypothetical protein K440DRAFT_642749 [Wilcoxina mikolae CBS 423.85]